MYLPRCWPWWMLPSRKTQTTVRCLTAVWENLLGVFGHPPVLVDVETLSSLPDRERRCGWQALGWVTPNLTS